MTNGPAYRQEQTRDLPEDFELIEEGFKPGDMVWARQADEVWLVTAEGDNGTVPGFIQLGPIEAEEEEE